MARPGGRAADASSACRRSSSPRSCTGCLTIVFSLFQARLERRMADRGPRPSRRPIGESRRSVRRRPGDARTPRQARRRADRQGDRHREELRATTTSCVGCYDDGLPGRDRDDPRAVRVGQEHVPALPQLPRGADGRGGRHRRRDGRGRPAQARTASGADQGPDPPAPDCTPGWCSRSSTCSRT